MNLVKTLFACLSLGSAALAQDAVKVGEFASMTGATATFGVSSHNGTTLAVEEINAGGGLLGKKINLVTEDDQSKAGQPATIVRKLISEDKVIAILGEIASSKSLEAAPIAQQNHVPMISPGSTNQKVTEVGDYIFRVCFIDPFQGAVMAKFAISRGWKRIAVLTDAKQDYSRGLADAFRKYFTAHGGAIVKDQSYSSGDKDFRAELTSVKAGHPDAVFVPGYYTEVGLIARQARQLGIKAPLLGGDGWDSEDLVQVGGEALEGDFFSNHFSTQDKSPAVQTFLAKYRDRFHTEADAMSALGYDSAMVLADAVKRARSMDGALVRDALAATKDYPGVTGRITIDDKRNATKPAVVLTIKDGKFQFVESIAP